jgi:UDP-glucose 4-epimerase
MKYKNILITGGAGFIGSHLAQRFLSNGHNVQVLDDLSTGSLDNLAHITDGRENLKIAVDSILNEMVVDRLVSECDIVYHLAAAVGVQLIVNEPVHTIRTNVDGTSSVLKAAERYRKRVVITSTSEVYGKSPDIPFREDMDTVSGPTTKHRWAYACSKALDEFAALAMSRQSGVPVHIVRLFNTVGVRQTGRYGMVVPRFIGQALRGEDLTVYGDGNQSRCFANVRDVVIGLESLMYSTASENEVINLGCTEEVTIRQLAEKVIELTGSSSGIVSVPYSEAYEDGFEDMSRRVPSIKKANDILNWKPSITLRETILEVSENLSKLSDFE